MEQTLILLAACAASAVVSAAVVGLLLRPGTKVEERLYGTWQSDGEATVSEWRERRPLTDEQADKLRKLFGHMRITWGRRTFETLMDGVRNEKAYRVVDKDEVAVVLRTWDDLSHRDEFTTINFIDADTYWLYAAGGPLREYFRRVR